MTLLVTILAGCSNGNDEATITADTATDPGPCPSAGYRLCYTDPVSKDTGFVPEPLTGRFDFRVGESTQVYTGPYTDPARLLRNERLWLGGQATGRQTARLSYRAERAEFDGFDGVDLVINGLPVNEQALAQGTYDCANPTTGTLRMTVREQVQKSGWSEVRYDSAAGLPCTLTIAEDVPLRGPNFDPKDPPRLRGTLEAQLVEIPTNGHQITFEGTFSDTRD